MEKSFWVGLIGGIAGICGAILAFFCGSFSSALSGTDSGLYMLGFSAIIFSILGVIGGYLEKKKLIGGILMIISAIGVLISISLAGVLACILFLIGGVIMLVEYYKENKDKPVTSPMKQ